MEVSLSALTKVIPRKRASCAAVRTTSTFLTMTTARCPKCLLEDRGNCKAHHCFKCGVGVHSICMASYLDREVEDKEEFTFEYGHENVKENAQKEAEVHFAEAIHPAPSAVYIRKQIRMPMPANSRPLSANFRKATCVKTGDHPSSKPSQDPSADELPFLLRTPPPSRRTIPLHRNGAVLYYLATEWSLHFLVYHHTMSQPSSSPSSPPSPSPWRTPSFPTNL